MPQRTLFESPFVDGVPSGIWHSSSREFWFASESAKILHFRCCTRSRVANLPAAERIKDNLSQNLMEMNSRPSKDNPKLFRGHIEIFKRKLLRYARKGRILRLPSAAPCLDLREFVEAIK